MPFEHRDHQADAVLVAWEATLTEAFSPSPYAPNFCSRPACARAIPMRFIIG